MEVARLFFSCPAKVTPMTRPRRAFAASAADDLRKSRESRMEVARLYAALVSEIYGKRVRRPPEVG
jgi:hypothetical protein